MIINILLLLIIIYILWLSYRNDKVGHFKINVVCWECGKRLAMIRAGESVPKNFPIYDSLPSYERMLFSFRRLESYLPKDVLGDFTAWESNKGKTNFSKIKRN